MGNYRHNPISGERVLIAPERGVRPHAFDVIRAESQPRADCPFCPGHESETPPEIARKERDGAWRVRVVPNRYPAMTMDPGGARGLAEVVIESRDHATEFENESPEQQRVIIETLSERYAALSQNESLAAISIFKNRGGGSGESISHPHSQIVALADLPPRLHREAHGFERMTSCPLCGEIERPGLLIETTDGFARIAPYASSFAYEQWVVPLRHERSLTETADAAALALATSRAIASLRTLFPSVGYNAIFVNPPRVAREFHWYLQIVPRLAQLGGFEHGTGMMINVVAPETAAARLRDESGERILHA